MKIRGKKIAFGLTSSFYTFKDTIAEIDKIVRAGGRVIPIMSFGAYTTDTKYGKAIDFIDKIEDVTKNKIIITMDDAEKVEADIMAIAPCSRKQCCKIRLFNI